MRILETIVAANYLPLLISAKTLKKKLQKHARLKRRTITLRSSETWYNEEIGKAKKKDSVGDSSVVDEHPDYISIERCMLNSVRLRMI